jgi:hypothetical protein
MVFFVILNSGELISDWTVMTIIEALIAYLRSYQTLDSSDWQFVNNGFRDLPNIRYFR